MISILEIFSYPFMIKALIVGVLISLVSALIGVSLVLRKNSMIGDGLSHTAFGAFALATVLGFFPTLFSIPVVILVSFFTLRLEKSRKINGDAAIALLSASSLALGTVFLSLSGGVNIDLNSYLFGSILSVSSSDVFLSLFLALFVLILYILSYNRIFSITFDEEFSKAIGIKTDFYDAAFAIICSVTVVLGMRLLGALLISSLIIFPTLIASGFSKSFKSLTIFSALVSVFLFILGLVLSFYLSTPTGATVVLTHLIFLILSRIAIKILKL